MNAPFAAAPRDRDIHDGFAVHADRWRGECIQSFAALEQSIHQMLDTLATVPRRGRKVRVNDQIGPSFAHLRELTSDKGPFAKEGKVIAASLRDLSPLFEWRAHLTHGVAEVWKGRGSKWLLTFTHKDPGSGPLRTHALTWTDAQEIHDRLQKAVPLFRSRCGSLRAAVLPD